MSAPTAATRCVSVLPCSSENQYRVQLLADLFTAYYMARKNKRNTYSQMRFEENLSENLVGLFHDIVNRRYKVGRSMCFIVFSPVKREVFAAAFRDRVVHHLLYNYLVPFYEPRFIYDSYSCRVGKGTLFGVERLEHHIRSVSNNYTRECWVLKMDLKGYFMSIPRVVLLEKIVSFIGRRVPDDDPKWRVMRYLLERVLLNDPTQGCYRKGKLSDWDGLPPDKSLFTVPEGRGLPIGNLTSQLFSNVYLDSFDQYVKRVLKVRHYGRYVDDFYIVGQDRVQLLACISPIRNFLDRDLGLKLHPKKIYLQRQERGVPFLGYILKNGKRYFCSRGRKGMYRNLDATLTRQPDPYLIQATVKSYTGYLSHTTAPLPGILNVLYYPTWFSVHY